MAENDSARLLLNIRYPIKPMWSRLLVVLNWLAFGCAALFVLGYATGWIAGATLKLIAQIAAPLLLLAVVFRLIAERRQAKDQIAIAKDAVVFQNEQLGVNRTEIDYLQIRAKAYRGMKSGRLLRYSGWENQLDLLLTDGRRCEAELLIPSAEEAAYLAKLETELGYLAVERDHQ
ncbi:MAG: hypothetical protein AAF433_12585 [Bacteroidota bacterium]